MSDSPVVRATLLVALLASLAALYLSADVSTPLVAVAMLVAAAFVVVWGNAWPKDPWRKYKKRDPFEP